MPDDEIVSVEIPADADLATPDPEPAEPDPTDPVRSEDTADRFDDPGL